MRTIPKIKVEFLPYYESIKKIPKDEIEELGLIMSDGQMNRYRRAFIEGLGGSVKDKTWSRRKHKHSCCKSKVFWRHLKTCKKLCRNAPEDLSDLKDL